MNAVGQLSCCVAGGVRAQRDNPKRGTPIQKSHCAGRSWISADALHLCGKCHRASRRSRILRRAECDRRNRQCLGSSDWNVLLGSRAVEGVAHQLDGFAESLRGCAVERCSRAEHSSDGADATHRNRLSGCAITENAFGFGKVSGIINGRDGERRIACVGNSHHPVGTRLAITHISKWN